MILSEAIRILEGNGFGAEITNKQLRKLLDDAGFNDVHLIKGNGYLYVIADNEPHSNWLNSLDSTAIYCNTFGQQSTDKWFSDILDMLHAGEEEYNAWNTDEYETIDESTETRLNEAYGQSDKEILADPDFWEYSRKVQEGWKKYGGTIFKKEDVATLRKDKAFKKSLKDEYVRRPTAYIDRFNSDFVEAEILRMYKTGYSVKDAVRELSDISCDASYMSDTEWEKSRKFHYNIQHGIFEDFGIGVGAPLGADQGIPMGGDMKAVVPYRMDGGRPACRCRCCGKKLRKKKKVRR